MQWSGRLLGLDCCVSKYIEQADRRGRQLRYLLLLPCGLVYTRPETAQQTAPKLLCPFSTRLDCGSNVFCRCLIHNITSFAFARYHRACPICLHMLHTT